MTLHEALDAVHDAGAAWRSEFDAHWKMHAQLEASRLKLAQLRQGYADARERLNHCLDPLGTVFRALEEQEQKQEQDLLE